MSQKEIRTLLKQAGLPDVLDEETGFPHPGMIIRHYREQMIYEDPCGVTRRWTQHDLSKILGVTELTVRLMETQNKGLNSMKRREILARILNIPPVLLGLSTASDLTEYLQHPTSVASLKATSLFDDALRLYWDAHYIGTPTANIPTIRAWIRRIRQETSGEYQQTLLCEWFLLLAHMYADQRHFTEAFSLLDEALQMARANDDKELEAAILYRTGHIHLDHHTFILASDALSQAHSLVKYANAPLCGAICQTAGLALAFTAQTKADHSASERALAKAAQLTDTTEHDPYYVRFNYGRYLLELGDTQIVLGHPNAALNTLDEADVRIGLDQPQRKGYISILRAEACTRLKKPRWDMATDQLINAFDLSKKARSAYNIDYIRRLNHRIEQSPYANSVDAVQLRLMLHNI